MGTHYKRAVGVFVVLVILALALAALPANGQDCGYPGCAHYLPTRTPSPLISPLTAPTSPAPQKMYLPFIVR